MNIKFYRERIGMTQAELAEKCDVSQNHISQIEMGKKTPSLELFKKLCEVLGVTEAELLNGPTESGYTVKLRTVNTLEGLEDEVMLNGNGMVTVADDGMVLASHKGKLTSREDKAAILAAIEQRLDEAYDVIESRARKLNG